PPGDRISNDQPRIQDVEKIPEAGDGEEKAHEDRDVERRRRKGDEAIDGESKHPLEAVLGAAGATGRGSIWHGDGPVTDPTGQSSKEASPFPNLAEGVDDFAIEKTKIRRIGGKVHA